MKLLYAPVNFTKHAITIFTLKAITKKYSDIFTHLTAQEKNTLYKTALSLNKNSIIVEIGSYLGASSCYLGEAAKRRKSVVHCVDTWENHGMTEGSQDTFERFCKNIEVLEDVITPLRGFSKEISRTFVHEIDMIFFDGGHSYEAVYDDWLSWSPKLKKGSVVVFHDIGWAEGVINLVNEIVVPLTTEQTSLPNMWWAKYRGIDPNRPR